MLTSNLISAQLLVLDRHCKAFEHHPSKNLATTAVETPDFDVFEGSQTMSITLSVGQASSETSSTQDVSSRVS